MAGAGNSLALTPSSDSWLVKDTPIYCKCKSKQVENWRVVDGNSNGISISINNGFKYGRSAASGFALECSKTSKLAFGLSENAVLREWRTVHMEIQEQNCTSRSRTVVASCSCGEDNGRGHLEIRGGEEGKNNGHIYFNSSMEEKQKSGRILGPGRQWENIFPAYMQSKSDFIDGDIEIPLLVQSENGVTRKTGNGVDGERAAAAAAASAKELESHVKSSAMSSVSPSVSAPPCSSAKPPTEGGKNLRELMSDDPIWAAMRAEARLEAEKEPLLSSYLYASILAHSCFERALGFVLANRLQNPTLLATQLMDVFDDVFMNDGNVRQSIRLDVQAVKDRDPACRSYSWALLYLKGYHALQSYRVAHALWNRGQRVLALALQSRISEVFAVDIHPAACIGKGILLDHGTGVVIGETAVVGDGVSMLQGVTLGGTGKEVGDRHPKIGGGVLIGAGATILGNITVGKGAMVAAGSLVLKDIPSHSMVAGTPAKVIGFLEEQNPALTMKHDATKGFCQLVAEDTLHGGAGI